MIVRGAIISYPEMCLEEGVNLQRGMNYRLGGKQSVILMSLRRGAPYADRVEDEGRVLIYEGHDIAATQGGENPKLVDQPAEYPSGALTQNGLFGKAACDYKTGRRIAEVVRVYEKIQSGIWVYNGCFRLVDAWQEVSNRRKVFKFRLELMEEEPVPPLGRQQELGHDRLIPAAVKLAVWQRDKGRCVQCGSRDNLHFDHVIPYSKGGSSLVAENIQILCARHNLEKRDRIE